MKPKTPEIPVLEGLTRHLERERVSFHMPGHKGRTEPLSARYDVTEVSDTGDLFAGRDFIQKAEDLWAEAWGMRACQFLTGGATQGVHAALLLCRRRGAKILVDRGCHRSVFNALGLFDYQPSYLLRGQEEPVTVEMVKKALEREKVNTICITSPTYYGVTSNIPELGRYCKEQGITLVVDGAHGCHLPFLQGKTEGEGWFTGADLVVSSAHKTLPVYGQGAVLMAGAESPFEGEELRWACSVTGSSSPSYPILLALDRARARFTTEEGRGELEQTVEEAERFCRRFAGMRGERMDPMRVTVRVERRVLDGFALQERLEGAGIYPEMADMDHLVLLFSPNNTREDYELLWEELEKIELEFPGIFVEKTSNHVFPEPEPALSPKEALLSRRRRSERPLEECAGEVAAQQVAPYPPGIPVIAPGEKITEKTIAYLREVGYNVKKHIDLVVL